MKTLNAKQLGFFDPVIGLTLFAIFSLTGAAVNSANTVESQQQVVCTETNKTVVQEDSQCK
jgi:hypothetical protein